MKRPACFKGYDVRGRLGEDLGPGIAWAIGRAFARVTGAAQVVTGRDVRASSPELQEALNEGLRAEGAAVTDIGLCGTEEIYFATDHLGADGGVMVTASHNPIDYNGMKFVLSEARPMPGETLEAMADLVGAGRWGARAGQGGLARADTRDAWADRVAGFLDPAGLGELTILADGGNGTAGPAFEALVERLSASGVPWRFVRRHLEPDATFPNGIPNPLLPENRPATAAAVREAGADLGLAWDGDFDRCFFYDGEGGFLDGEYVVALLARAFLVKEPGAVIVHDPRVVRATRDAVARAGGRAEVSRTGHTHMKAAMRATGAAYGGEMSAHHYFRDFMACDSGMIPWLLMAGLVAREGALAEMVREMRAAFPSSGEINFRLDDTAAAVAAFEARYLPGAETVDRLDGISVEHAAWRANLRQSNTEPLLRLNVETVGDRSLLEEKVAEISELLRRAGGR